MSPKTCACLSDKRRAEIKTAMAFAAGFSDSSFLAYMEEKGIDVSELEVFSPDHECEVKS